MVMLVPGMLALVFGWLAFRSRVTGVYLSIITQALTYALMLAFFRNDMGFGGNNGFTDFKDILGFDLAAPATRMALFLMTALALGGAICCVAPSSCLARRRVIQAVRDAESRARFIGFRVESYKLWVFVFSAVLAGIAGALYVPQVGIINPSEFSPANSIEIVIWVAVGGRGTLYGAVVGAFAGQLRQDLLHRRAAQHVAVRTRRVVRAGDAVPAAAAWSGLLTARRRAPAHRRRGPNDPRACSNASPAVRAARIRRASGRCSTATVSAPAPTPRTASILYLEDITVSFDGFKALNELTLYVEAGELRCIIGPNGAGKTTMMDVITGKTRPGLGLGLVRPDHRSAGAHRAGDRAGRHRPQVPEADGVRAAHGVRESRARDGGRQDGLATGCARTRPPNSSSRSTTCSRPSA